MSISVAMASYICHSIRAAIILHYLKIANGKFDSQACDVSSWSLNTPVCNSYLKSSHSHKVCLLQQ